MRSRLAKQVGPRPPKLDNVVRLTRNDDSGQPRHADKLSIRVQGETEDVVGEGFVLNMTRTKLGT